MPYPYSWKPSRVALVSASQVTVWNTSTGAAAALSTAVSVSNGTLSFSLTNAGKYRISVRNGNELETGTFDVDVTGVDVSTPEWITYSYHDKVTDLTGSTSSTAFSTYVGVPDLVDPASQARKSLEGLFAQLKNLARNPDLIIAGAVTRDANGAATSAPVVWPDGTVGTYTADTVSTAFPGAVDAYHITYGSPVTKTYTQPAITRDSSGAAITVPAIVVS